MKIISFSIVPWIWH